MIVFKVCRLNYPQTLFTCILLIVLGLPLFSQEGEVVKVDPTKAVGLTEIFETVKVVGLEQEYPALFGLRFLVIIVGGNKIYLCPVSQKRRMIFGYDMDGKLLHVIDNFGPGPDQLGRVSALQAIEENILSIYTQEKGRFYDYDVLEDKIIGEHKYSGSGATNQFLKNPKTNEYYVLKGVTTLNMYKPPYYWLTKLNRDLEEVDKFFPERTHFREPFSYMPTLKNNLQLFDDNIRVLKPYGDTIYSVNQNKASPTYVLDFGEYKKYNTQTVTPEKVKSVFLEKNGVRGVSFFETENRLLLYYTFGVDRLTVFNKKIKASKTVDIFKPFDRDVGFLLSLVYADDDKAIFTYRGGSRVDEFLKSRFDIANVENWSELDFDQMEQDEIPLLLIFKFKK